MDRNDLYHMLESNPAPDKLLKAINYADYSDKEHTHAGDSDHGQWIFWEAKKEDLWGL